VVAFGGLGVFAATTPADWMATHYGWRSLFYVLAAATVAVAALVYALSPHGTGNEGSGRKLSWGAQLRGIGPVFATSIFWRIAPMVALVTGGFIAVQTLWTARWLTDVRLLDGPAVAANLMAMAVSFSVGSLLTGFVADWTTRTGIGLKAVMVGSFVVLGAAELGLVFDAPIPSWLLVTLLGLAGSGSNLAYVTLADKFGPAMAGRAQTSLNLCLFLAAALLQSGIGWALDLINGLGFSGGAVAHYALVLGVLVVAQTASVIWFASDRARGRLAHPRSPLSACGLGETAGGARAHDPGRGKRGHDRRHRQQRRRERAGVRRARRDQHSLCRERVGATQHRPAADGGARCGLARARL
jgi:predicted MFS family arabinose efflux permease